MEYVGSAAGGTLGFIVGNIPGAYIGSKAGYNLSKNKQMAVIKNKRPREEQVAKTYKKTTKGGKKLGKVYGPRSKISNVNANVVGQSARQAVHKRVKDGIKEKKRKKVKVPKLLKKQILQVFDKKDVYGTMNVIMHGSVADLNTNRYIDQKVFPLPLPRIADNKQAGLLFDPYYWQFVAARLFNNRPAEQPTTGAWGNIVTESGTDWENFNQLTSDGGALKLTVQKAYAVIKMKNNTSRTMYLRMYVSAPKYQRISGTMNDADGHAINDWKRALAAEGGLAFNAGTSATADATQAMKVNVGGYVTVNTMYAKPTDVQTFNRLWKTDCYTIVLEPGQVHNHTIQGDEIELDYSKMFVKSQSSSSGLTFADLQKFSRCVYFTGVTEMAYDSAVGGVRAQNNQVGPTGSTYQAQYLLFETEIHAKIKMPEITGGSAPAIAASGSKTLVMTNRKRAYVTEQFWNSASLTNTGFEMNVDDNTTGLQTQ